MTQIKRIPYGVADFVQLRKENMYYVDKTMYIPMLEKQGNFLFFIRPRRFGKSLLLSMLSAYYDSRNAGRFDALFGALYSNSLLRPMPRCRQSAIPFRVSVTYRVSLWRI